MTSVCILELPSNLGLKEPQAGREPGVKNLPDWLRKHNFHRLIQAATVLRLEPPTYNNTIDAETGILNVDAIVDYSIRQATMIREMVTANHFPLLLGGDCSILIGSALALKQNGDYGVFYLDGHTDFMSVSLSETGGAGGMAASLATGSKPQKLSNILNLSPYIKEENLWCVGNREYDDVYENEIRNSSAKYISLDMLRKRGIVNCVRSFLEEMEIKQVDGFWIHIDVDVLNDEIMPCVDSRTSDGLTYAEFNQLTGLLFESSSLTGLEITILDPDLDPGGQYTQDFVSNFTSTFNNARHR